MANRVNPRKPSPEKAHFQPHSFRLGDDAQWGGFVNIRLSDDDKANFSAWYGENAAQSGVILDELLAAGMKVSLSYDMANACYICSFTGRLMSFSDERFVMTTRAGTLNEVLALACWKHVCLVKGDYDRWLYKPSQAPNWG